MLWIEVTPSHSDCMHIGQLGSVGMQMFIQTDTSCFAWELVPVTGLAAMADASMAGKEI